MKRKKCFNVSIFVLRIFSLVWRFNKKNKQKTEIKSLDQIIHTSYYILSSNHNILYRYYYEKWNLLLVFFVNRQLSTVRFVKMEKNYSIFSKFLSFSYTIFFKCHHHSPYYSMININILTKTKLIQLTAVAGMIFLSQPLIIIIMGKIVAVFLDRKENVFHFVCSSSR